VTVLARVARKYDCYFCVEEHWKPGTDMYELNHRRIRPPQGESLTAVLEDLGRGLPDAKIFRDGLNEKLYHVVKTVLLADGNYVMSRKIDSFDFTGTPRTLLAYLSSQGFPIQMTRGMGVPVSYGPDLSRSDKHVTAKNAEVRSVIAGFLTLDRRCLVPIHTYTYTTERATPLTVVEFDLIGTGLGLPEDERHDETNAPPTAPPQAKTPPSIVEGSFGQPNPPRGAESAGAKSPVKAPPAPPPAAVRNKTGGPGWLYASAAVAAGGLCLIALLRLLRRVRA
jgi:hypothetical protein